MDNKKEIKIYLQYPWKFPDSPYYKYLIDYPPEEIKFENISNQKGVIINKKFFWFSNFLKRNIRRGLDNFNLSLPNSHLSPEGDYDLIHCAHCMSNNKNKPWVMDIESEWQLYVGKKNKNSKDKVKKILLSRNCKKILPWTKTTAKELIKEFPEIKNKIEVIYPAVPLKIIKKENNKKIILFFSGRYFYEKGGLYALEVIDKLTKKHLNVYGIFNSQTPEEILKRYEDNKKIKFYSLIPQKELFKLYKKADFFIYPGFSDTFGFGFLEAMSFGLPIITIEGYARKEIIKDKGIIIKKPENFIFKRDIKELREDLVREILKKTEHLILNEKLKKKMSKNCLEEIKNGKFSIKERNKKLKKIYEEALK